MKTVVIDCGEHCVGVLSVEDQQFRVFRAGPEMDEALALIQSADEVVTYNGKRYDLRKLAEIARLEGPMQLRGMHTDMRSVIWSDEILGSGLISTYQTYFASWPDVPDTYEGRNIQSDVLMTLALWKRWTDAGRGTFDRR